MQSPTSYHVIETPHESVESEASICQFNTRHEALITSAKRTRANITELAEAGLSAGELFDKWLRLGKGYRIEPEDSQAPFSDIDYVRLFVLRLTNDYSHPLFFEVVTTDCLRTVSGVRSPARNWKFWVKAPATYKNGNLNALMRAATEVLYEDMSEQSRNADGSSYVLLDMTFRAVEENEANAAIDADKSATIYFVQNDCSFKRVRPVSPTSK